MSAHAFTAGELDQPERHEFFHGEVFRVFGMGWVFVALKIPTGSGNLTIQTFAPFCPIARVEYALLAI